jgi:hypothetical protein
MPAKKNAISVAAFPRCEARTRSGRRVAGWGTGKPDGQATWQTCQSAIRGTKRGLPIKEAKEQR